MFKFRQLIKRQNVDRSGFHIDSPKVSILLPLHAHFSEKHIISCMDSVLAQSLSEYECLVLDCGISKKFLQIIKEYALRDSRILLIRHDIDLDLPVACLLDEGIILAEAPYVAINANGTIWRPDTLHRLFESAESTQADLVFGNVSVLSRNKSSSLPGTFPVSRESIDNFNPIPNGAILINKGFFQKYGLFDPHIIMRQVYDWDLWHRALKLGAYFYHLDYLVGTQEATYSRDEALINQEFDIFSDAYLSDNRNYLNRTVDLQPDTILEYDIIQTEKLLQYVRDFSEWDRVEEKYFKPLGKNTSDIEYSPPTRHNRRYDPTLNGYSLNPPMAVSKPRKRIVVVTNIVDRVVEDWISALAQDPNNIIIIGFSQKLELINPVDIDFLIIFDCVATEAMEMAKKFRDKGVIVALVLVRNNFHEDDYDQFNIQDQLVETQKGTLDSATQDSRVSFDKSLLQVDNYQLFIKLREYVDQAFVVGDNLGDGKNLKERIAYVQFPFNGQSNHELEKAKTNTFNWGIYIGNSQISIKDVLTIFKNQLNSAQWTLFVSEDNEILDQLNSLPDNHRIIITNETLGTLVSNISNFFLIVPDIVITALNTYQHLLIEEDAARMHNAIVPFSENPLSLDAKWAKEWFKTAFDKWKIQSINLHPQARFIHIQNLILGLNVRKKIATLRGQGSSAEVKALVMVNSQAIAGSENYGLLVTKGLANLGFDVHFCTPASVNTYPQGIKTSKKWLEQRNLPSLVQAEYGKAGFAIWHPVFPKQAVLEQSEKLRKWLDEEGIGLVFCSAMIPEPFIVRREKALAFMALFAPWDYYLDRLTFIGETADGLFSDSYWALEPWTQMNPTLKAYAPSMIEEEYFQVVNQDLPEEPVQIAIAGTIQPRKRQKEAVLAIQQLIMEGWNVKLNIYGYQLEDFQTYIQDIKALNFSP